MMTVSFQVPDEVKEAVDEAFKGRGRDAVIADLMRESVEREEHGRWAIGRILGRRRGRRALSGSEFCSARHDGRT